MLVLSIFEEERCKVKESILVAMEKTKKKNKLQIMLEFINQQEQNKVPDTKILESLRKVIHSFDPTIRGNENKRLKNYQKLTWEEKILYENLKRKQSLMAIMNKADKNNPNLPNKDSNFYDPWYRG